MRTCVVDSAVNPYVFIYIYFGLAPFSDTSQDLHVGVKNCCMLKAHYAILYIQEDNKEQV